MVIVGLSKYRVHLLPQRLWDYLTTDPTGDSSMEWRFREEEQDIDGHGPINDECCNSPSVVLGLCAGDSRVHA